MKVEIELEELENLRKQLSELQDRVKENDTTIYEMSQQRLVEKATELSKKLLNDYIGCIFKKLGFDVKRHNTHAAIDQIQLNHYLEHPKTWFEQPDRIKVELSASLTEDFKMAFLHIGAVVTPIESMVETDYFKL